jgi:predicted nucleic acid-binding protein
VTETVLVDTGAWIALFDESSGDHEEIIKYADVIEAFPLIVPWPIVYETLRTRFARRPAWVTAFNSSISRAGVTLVDDSMYRVDAFSLTVDYATRRKRDISMVDMLCRLLIEAPDVKVDCLITPNKKDFVDVCYANGVEILP